MGIIVPIMVSFMLSSAIRPSVHIVLITTVKVGRITPPAFLKEINRIKSTTNRTKGIKVIRSRLTFCEISTIIEGIPAI